MGLLRFHRVYKSRQELRQASMRRVSPVTESQQVIADERSRFVDRAAGRKLRKSLGLQAIQAHNNRLWALRPLENPRVGGSIPSQATNKVNDLAQSFRLGFVVYGCRVGII